MPVTTPMAATQRIDAAVVSPRVSPLLRAPDDADAQEADARRDTGHGLPGRVGNIVIAVPENAAAPRATIANVRSPALLPRDSRSRPIEAEQRSESHPRGQRQLERQPAFLEGPHGASD